jgi:hypothetical protein
MASEPVSTEKPDPTTLDRLRNMSEFAALNQYLYMFGEAIKADQMDIEVRLRAHKLPGR